MWISVPTPLTTSIIVTERVSTRKAQCDLQAADGDPIQEVDHGSLGMAAERYGQKHRHPKEAATARLAIAPTSFSFSRLPNRILISSPIDREEDHPRHEVEIDVDDNVSNNCIDNSHIRRLC